ncbi:ferritin-like metal-binding protein YciE [Anseongella ginsenosidimutans]|uniref:Ferritin-like metal-binding protein YciE n=1 Tax=Anseongella ginsenosidimutans TaxID=496056 RepID=A0A4R3KR79_9SPHI|nr:DUF892 family protein [Anseongella ginsenosidimutans]TCS87428.1 ferritin-like metal-binding protein YciE [Anseongella ginsenosidimutans]
MKDLNLQQLFLEQLKDFYGAEIQIAAFLPEMVIASTPGKLRTVLSGHLQMTQNQLSLLEKVFKNLNENPRGSAGPAVKGLLEEGKKVITGASEPNHVTDTALIIAARKVHHYEMASFGSLVALAGEIGDKEVADLLGSAESHSALSAAGL